MYLQVKFQVHHDILVPPPCPTNIPAFSTQCQTDVLPSLQPILDSLDLENYMEGHGQSESQGLTLKPLPQRNFSLLTDSHSQRPFGLVGHLIGREILEENNHICKYDALHSGFMASEFSRSLKPLPQRNFSMMISHAQELRKPQTSQIQQRPDGLLGHLIGGDVLEENNHICQYDALHSGFMPSDF